MYMYFHQFEVTMETHASTNDELDDIFDQLLVKMKPHVLHLAHKSDRQKCANWIKKLCETPVSTPHARKKRNAYGKLLLHMLQKGVLEGPFEQEPRPGPLETLPTNMMNTNLEMAGYDIENSDTSRPSFLYQTLQGRVNVRQYEQDLEMRMKMTEVKYHEEKLQLQQKHDQAIEKILSRKNSEIEDIKTHYSRKSKEMDSTIRKLERKVQSLVKEMMVLKESKDEQITELSKMVEHSDQSTQNEFETKLHHRVAEFEQEKFEMQKQHTKAIQGILDDTNSRLHKMETEYSTQVDNHAVVIKELEARIQQLSQESENHRALQMQLGEEKSELERTNALLSTEMDSVQARCSVLEMEAGRIKDEFEIEMRAIKKQAEDSIELMKHEHSLLVSKSASNIHDLEQHVQELKHLLKNSENQRQRDLGDLESLLKQDKIHQENLHKQQITDLKSQLERERQENHSTMLKLQEAVRNKEEEIKKVVELKKLQSQQAEKTLEDFEQQAEQNSSRMFKDMTAQIQRVEVDLKESEQLKQAQIVKLVRQLEQEKQLCQKQLNEQDVVHTQKYNQLVEKHQRVLKSLKKEHQHILTVTTDKLQSKLEENTTRSKQWHDRDAERIVELEQQVHEILGANRQSMSLRNQLDVEIGLLRKEKEHAEQAKENAQEERDATITRLNKVEEDFSERLAKSTENVRHLENTIDAMREDSTSCRNQLEKQLEDAVTKIEDEKELLKKQHIAHLKSLHQDLDQQKSEVRHLQRQLHQKVFKHQDEMMHFKQEHERKLKLFLPHHMRKKLENTLDSMKSQVATLQQKNSALHEEIERGNTSTMFTMPSPSNT